MQDLQSLDWPEVLERTKGFATSESGRERVGQTAPLESAEAALHCSEEILQALQLVASGTRPHLGSLDLCAPWISRLKKNAVLKILEIKDVRSFCLECVALREACANLSSETANPWATTLSASLMEAGEPLSAIDQIMTPSGDIRSDASERLYGLFQEKERLGREVQSTLERLVRDHQMENLLQDKFVTTREGRWVLPIKGGMQHFMPGVIHATSQTKQTVFMEPERIIPTNNRLRQIEIDIEDEIERLLTELSRYLSGKVHEFEDSRRLMEISDVRLAQAQFSAQVSAGPFSFSEGKLDLLDVRHPLLQLAGRKVVPNSVQLGENKSILLLSGPNAGGKTVLLKSVGLAVQMARCGLPICASESSTLPFFRSIQVGIGDAQSVGEELSTFAAHLKILDQATTLQGPAHLILIDEICGSTDPEEGSALARSFIESFSEQGVFAVITSHLGPLKAGWSENGRVLNGSLEYDPKSGRPTYHFIAGIPGDSLAIQTAKRVGVAGKIVERAVEVLTPSTRARLEGLEQIEKLKSDISALQDHLRKETQSAQALKKKYERMVDEFEKEKEGWLNRSLKKAEKKVEEAIQQAKADQVFTRHRQLQEIKHQLPEIVKAKPVDRGAGAESAEDFARRFPAGSKVFVPSLGQDGLVQSAPNSKGEVMVMSNSLRLLLPWRELKPAHKPQNPTAKLARQAGHAGAALSDEDRTLDLRGKTVDEAVEELELALDRAVASGEDRLKIVHGHGTEALKKTVRTYLSRSVYVKKWKAGSPESGGDGVTWVELGEA